VKWFSSFDVAGQPLSLANVLCLDFELLVGLSLLALFSGSLVEPTPVGAAMIRAMDRVTGSSHDNTELLFRAGCGLFFISIWAIGGILITPELKTASPAVGFIQIGIAAGMLSRRTMPLSGLGIVVLYLIGVWNYGIFHLADYPIFLGIAAYMILTGLQRNFYSARPIDIVRWAAGITLMWASVEKWAFPEWSYPLLIDGSTSSLGFDPAFYMRAAGAVEFALAFALMWTPLVRRMSAVLLTGMFLAAIVQFGKIDFIGHSMIIVVLIAIIGDNQSSSKLARYPWLSPIGYASALSAFLGVYYVAHSLLFGSTPLA
jgi:hypothetical protein